MRPSATEPRRDGGCLRARASMVVAALGLAACGGKGPPPPAPPPHRPTPTEAAPAAADTGPRAPADCTPTDPSAVPPSVAYPQRSIAEGENLAREGTSKLVAAEERGVDRASREQLLTEAVDLLITALAADPYNVHATYNLAAAYARIDRRQCALNLLERLVLLGRLASQQALVEEKVDRLLGRKQYARNRDRDFDDLRTDERFRRLVRDLEPATP